VQMPQDGYLGSPLAKQDGESKVRSIDVSNQIITRREFMKKG